MANTYSLNTQALREAAAEAGHLHTDGKLNIYAISKHTGLDRAVLTRVVRDDNGPDLATVVELAAYARLPIEGLIVRRATPRPSRHRTRPAQTTAPSTERAA